jgi:hypothetical protein
MACSAFSKTNGWLPCLSRVQKGKDTCVSHKNFYKKKEWMSLFLNPESSYTYFGFHTPHEDNLHLDAITYSIKSGRIVLTEEDMRSLPDDDRLTDIYTVLCKIKAIHPLWNTKILTKCIRTFLRIRRFSRDLPRSSCIGFYRLTPFIEYDPQSIMFPMHIFFQILEFEVIQKTGSNPMLCEMIRDTLQRLTLGSTHSCYLEPYHPFNDPRSFNRSVLCWYSNEYLLSVGDGKTLLDLIERCPELEMDVFTALQNIKRPLKALKDELKVRMAPLKCELVSVVYHPKNVEKWLLQGGFPLLDMMT